MSVTVSSCVLSAFLTRKPCVFAARWFEFAILMNAGSGAHIRVVNHLTRVVLHAEAICAIDLGAADGQTIVVAAHKFTQTLHCTHPCS
jgi:hypothetical protein